ncbi:MAG TPA: peptidoglycan DD-metalloendopeptidase family protein [Rhodanobacteraceae bacterium]|nr:peptidoglycan DD-metalloendopeptidase family protein [Rhodanobacteraceae bacterium]
MRILISWSELLLIGIAAALLGGCATAPAPVVDRSLGNESGAQVSARSDHGNGQATSGGYVVARGDTLYSIAFRHGMDYRALAQRNGIAPPYVIYPGQVLRIADGTLAHAPQRGPERKVIARTPVPPREVHPQNNAPVFETVPGEPEPVPRNPAPASSTSVAMATHAEPSSGANTVGSGSATPPPVSVANPVPAPTANPSVKTASQPLSAIVAGKTRSVDGITWLWPADGAVISGFQNGAGSGAGLDIAGNAGDPVRAAADGVVVYSGNGLIGYGELIIIKHSDSYLSAYGHNRKRLVQEGEHVRAGQLIAEMGSSGAPREELHFEIRKNGKPVDPADYLPGR